MSRDDARLLDMLNAARKIRAYTTDLTLGDFRSSQLHQSAVLRELQVIGEAARVVSDASKLAL